PDAAAEAPATAKPVDAARATPAGAPAGATSPMAPLDSEAHTADSSTISPISARDDRRAGVPQAATLRPDPDQPARPVETGVAAIVQDATTAAADRETARKAAGAEGPAAAAPER